MKGFGSKLSSEASTAGNSAGTATGGKFKSGFLGGMRGMAGPLAATLGVAAVGGFLKSAITGSSDLAESASKVNVVFGKQGPAIMKASETSARAMGLSKGAYLEATGGLGNLLVSLDIAPKKAAGLSQSMVTLAGDMASFNNTSPEEALAALRSGLTGETEPLKKYGVNMNDATLKAQALKMGLIETTKDALTPQSKALAAQALIMAQTGTAQGDFARTSGGLANQQRILSAQFDDVKAKVGGALLPAFTGIVTFFNTQLLPGIGAVASAFKEGGIGGAISFVGTAISNALPGIQAKLGEWGTAFWAWVQAAVPPMLVKLGELAVKLGGWVTGTVLPWLGEKLAQWGRAFVEWIGPMIPPALSALGAAAGRLFNWLIDTGLPRLLTNLRKWGEAFVEWVAPMIPPALAEIGKLLGKLVVWIVGTGLPKLVGALMELGWELVKWIGPMIPKVVVEIGKLIGQMVKWIVTDGVPKMLGVGQDIVAGLIQGIRNKVGDLVQAAKDLASSIPGSIKKLLGISSPSKVGIDIGENFSHAIGIGLTKGKPKALEAVGSLIDAVRTKLTGLRDAARSVATSVADSVRSIVDVSAIGAPIVTGQDADGNDITRTPSAKETFSGWAAQAAAFAAALATMAGRGLAPAVIAAVAAAGPGNLAAAQALAGASESDLASINASSAQIAAAAKASGSTVMQTTPLPAQIKREEDTLAELRELRKAFQDGLVNDVKIKGDDIMVVYDRAKQKAGRRG